MKVFTLLTCLFSLVLFSCSKKKESFSNCYTCQITGASYSLTLDTCSNSTSSTYHFQDANGNSLGFFCQSK